MLSLGPGEETGEYFVDSRPSWKVIMPLLKIRLLGGETCADFTLSRSAKSLNNILYLLCIPYSFASFRLSSSIERTPRLLKE